MENKNTQDLKDLMAQVAQTQTRSRQYLGYWRAGIYVQIWGLVWLFAYLACYFFPHHSNLIWLIGDVVGISASAIINWSAKLTEKINPKVWWVLAILMGFGVITSTLIGNQVAAPAVFWTLLFMSAYMIGGLWLGTRWIVLGASVIALTLLNYWFFGPWFNLLMAFVSGGALILGGTWLRRAA